MKRWAIPLAALGMLCVLLASVLMTLDRVGTDGKVYALLEDEVGDYEYVGMTREDTLASLSDLAAYLRGELSELTRQAPVRGQMQTVFNERERAHMVDVRALFVLARRVRRALWAAGFLLLLAASFAAKRPTVSLAWGLALSWGIAALCLGAGLMIGFDALFIRFHRLFFTNDLWLMDPRTDAMIRMLPEDFFEGIVRRMARPVRFLGAQALFGGCCLLARRIRDKWSGKDHAL